MTMEISVPTTPPPAETTPAPGESFLASAPEEYREKEWAVNFSKTENPTAELFKAYDHARSKIGEKAGLKVPGETATPEEWKAFHKALGAPDSIEGYQYQIPALGDDVQNKEQLAEVLKGMQSDSLISALKAAAQENGMTPKQFAALAEVYNKTMVDEAQAQLAAAAQIAEQDNAQFQENFKKFFGDRADSVMANNKALAQKAIPEAMRETGDAELFLHQVLDWVHTNYIANTQLPGGAKPAGSNVEAVKNELASLRSSEAFRNKFHPENEAMTKRVLETHRKLAALESAGT